MVSLLFNFGKKKKEALEKAQEIAFQKGIDVAKKQYISGEVSLFDFLGQYNGYGGDKIDFNYGGFGPARGNNAVNLYKMQLRSQQLYTENPYAAAIVNRIVTKTVNSGYRLRTTPMKSILNFLPDDYFKNFSEMTESLFHLYGENKALVSIQGDKTLSELQSLAMRSSLIYGHCLCIQYYSKSGLPQTELIDGIHLRTPMMSKNIVNGVEYNKKGEIVAYHVRQSDLATGMENFKRIEAKDKNGRLKAWLIKSGNSHSNSATGMPIFAVILQNLNDVGRYLDSEQRAALVNSYIAVVHQKASDMPDNVNAFMDAGTDKTVQVTDGDATTKDMNFKKMNPGFFATNLEKGEEIKSFDTSRPNVNFGTFADVVTKPMFYVNGIPPEVLKMEYNSNYIAASAARSDFDDRAREFSYFFNGSFSGPLYHNWLDCMILKGTIKAPQYIESMKSVDGWVVLGAYRSHIWRGLPKRGVDGLKQAKENVIAVANGWSTNTKIADEQYGTDYDSNMEEREGEAVKEKGINDTMGVDKDGTILPK